METGGSAVETGVVETGAVAVEAGRPVVEAGVVETGEPAGEAGIAGSGAVEETPSTVTAPGGAAAVTPISGAAIAAPAPPGGLTGVPATGAGAETGVETGVKTGAETGVGNRAENNAAANDAAVQAVNTAPVPAVPAPAASAPAPVAVPVPAVPVPAVSAPAATANGPASAANTTAANGPIATANAAAANSPVATAGVPATAVNGPASTANTTAASAPAPAAGSSGGDGAETRAALNGAGGTSVAAASGARPGNVPAAGVPVRGAAEGTAVVPLSPPPQQPPSRGEQVMKALAQAYPDRIGSAEFRDGDWAVPIRGVWFYYANGRLLPQELRGRAAEYDPQSFYNYPAELPPWRDPTAEESERFRAWSQELLQHPVKRSQHFFDALWRATNRDEAWDRVKSLRFLGRPVYVHYSILEELSLVEELILVESKTNAQVRQWINNLDVLDGWNWRSIANSESRSFHSYGAALDLLPKSTGSLETYWATGNRHAYWLWTARVKSDWWAVPYSQRAHPPEAVIKAFEAYGFAWGGKWTDYDTMHFEYRPDIFILNGLPLSALR
jgi:hypothetical protein